MTVAETMSISTAAFVALLGAVAIAAPLATQAQTATQSGQESRYILKDLGTAGGPNSYIAYTPRPVNSRGAVTGIADTTASDPLSPCIVDCFVVHTFQWQHGVLTDLGALVAGASSLPNAINASGVIAGLSETGAVDATAPFPPEFHAVVWKEGRIIDLGTLGGDFSYADDINARGQVVGFALNGRSDAYIPRDNAFSEECGAGPMGTEMRAFIWQQGRGMRALGTLGGPESCALYVNQRGQVTGASFTSYTPNAGSGIPTFEPFIWTDGKMTSLGSLGGTQGHAKGFNNQGQVVGVSTLAGDNITHAFFWDHGQMIDVVPGSDYAEADALNDKGEVVGGATYPSSRFIFAYLWRDGVLTHVNKCSNALSINSSSQVVGQVWSSQIVGQAFKCGEGGSHAFFWERGGPAIDLNTLVPAHSGVTLTTATYITDAGDIAAQGTLANGDEHAFLLIPRKADGFDSRTGSDGAYLLQGTVLTLTPRWRLDFGNRSIHSHWWNPGGVKSVTVTNTSAKVVAIASIAITSGTGHDDFTSTNNCGSSLTGHATCTITVTFHPFRIGAKTATLKVYDGGGGLYSIHMTGTGT